jgi:hypothetical protein
MSAELQVPTHALTLTQPWATLVALGAKTIETRSWSTAYRGPIAIHAAKGFPGEARDLCSVSPFRQVLQAAGIRGATELPTGVIVCVTEIDHCYRFAEQSDDAIRSFSRKGKLPEFEALFGDFSPGRFGFRLNGVFRLTNPVPARGMLNLWRIDPTARALLEQELRAA